MSVDCEFCRIVEDRHADRFNAASAAAVAITPKKLGVTGHQLIIPRVHYESIFDISPDALSELMQFIQQVSLAMRNNSGVAGINLLHASGAAAQQSVPHFHVHLLPRFYGDDINAWPDLPGSTDPLGNYWRGVT